MEYRIKFENVSNSYFEEFLKAKSCTQKEAILSTLSKVIGKSVEELSLAWDKPSKIVFYCDEDLFEVVNS